MNHVCCTYNFMTHEESCPYHGMLMSIWISATVQCHQHDIARKEVGVDALAILGEKSVPVTAINITLRMLRNLQMLSTAMATKCSCAGIRLPHWSCCVQHSNEHVC